MDKALAGMDMKPRAVSLATSRMACLAAAILVYGFAGTPTPDAPGLVEGIVGVLLLLAAGGWQVCNLFRRPVRKSWEGAAIALLLYGLPVPLLTGVMAGNDSALMARDMISFLFFLLPLFLLPATGGAASARLVTAAVAVAGVLFGLRAAGWFYGVPVTDAFHLANAPTVLFAALLLLGMAGQILWHGFGARNLALSLGLAFAACIPLAAMALAMQRAGMAMVAAVLLVLAVIGLVHRPRRVILPLAVLGCVLWLGQDVTGALAQDLMAKNALVGFNMRGQEAAAVLDEIAGSAMSVLFGKGWGAVYASPAVGGMTVNFTHSLLTTYLLKTGLCGLALAVIYLAALALRLVPLLFRHPVMALAIGGPFLINILLYASFKSLDFGLLLFLIPLWADRCDLLHKGPACSNH